MLFKTKSQPTFKPSNSTAHERNKKKPKKHSSKGTCVIPTQTEISYFSESIQELQRTEENKTHREYSQSFAFPPKTRLVPARFTQPKSTAIQTDDLPMQMCVCVGTRMGLKTM